MEIICVDKQTFEELRVRFCDFEERMTRVCRPAEEYRNKGILPFSRIKNKLFYKPEDVQRLLDLNYHPLIKSRL